MIQKELYMTRADGVKLYRSYSDSYKAATNWSTYADQIKPLSEYTGG